MSLYVIEHSATEHELTCGFIVALNYLKIRVCYIFAAVPGNQEMRYR